jgi:[ribosomal protein S5]-alanine N-acetyltransferase
MELIPITPASTAGSSGLPEGSDASLNFKMQVDYYAKVGFNPPWIGYLVRDHGVPVGMGAFKGPPIHAKVEIAYFTFPEFEGKGLATRTCKALVETALAENPSVVVTARTLPQKNASTRILGKNGFEFSSAVQDPDDGEVWEWVYAPEKR